jgi:hypothetical protein
MVAGGVGTDPQAVGDLVVARPQREKTSDVRLPRRQTVALAEGTGVGYGARCASRQHERGRARSHRSGP